MSPERWRQIERLYHAALECDAPEAFLDEACAGDEALRREVESLLRFDRQAETFIEAPALEVAARLPVANLEQSFTGRMIGHYRVLSLLGEGGMGEVYLALDTRLDRQVAIKLLPAQFTQDAERLRRFIREAKAASALNHPNIITIHEIGEVQTEAGGLHFIVAEFIDGQTLRQRMAAGRMSLRETLNIAAQVTSALAVAHAAGIVHRDIKPENVMVRPDGYVKVLDFGIAKLAEERGGERESGRAGEGESGRAGEWGSGRAGERESGGGGERGSREGGERGSRGEMGDAIPHSPTPPLSHSPTPPLSRSSTLSLSTRGLVLGTAHYMSPEQARGLRVDGRADIFSLGIMLYEMIAGRRPFAGETRTEVVRAVLQNEPPPLSQFAPAIPLELQEVIGRALRKDREERYQSAKDLLAELQRLRRELRADAEWQTAASPTAHSSEASTIGGPVALATLPEPVAPTATHAPIRTVADERKGGAKSQPSRRLSRQLSSWLFALIAIVLIAVAVIRFFPTRQGTAIDSLAVLPFINTDADKNAEYLADGLTENLINSLSQLPEMKVIASGSVFRFKAKQTDPQAIGKQLGVRAVLTGRIAQRGESLTISAELINARDGARLWGEQYERRLADILSLQEEVTRHITAGLHLKLTDVESKHLGKRYTENAQAYHLYLRGRYFFLQFSADGIRKGLEYFNQAIALDPNYALAYAGIGYAYAVAASQYEKPGEAMGRARQASFRALQLDETLPEAHFSLALVKWWSDWEWAGAENEFRRAMELNPHHAIARAVFSDFLTAQGRFEEALEQAERALELDPLSLYVNGAMGKALFHARQYDRALAAYQKTLELDPDSARTHRNLGRVLLQQGKYSEAIAELRKAYAREQHYYFLADLGHAYAVAGRRNEARQTLIALQRISREKYLSPFYIAKIHAGLGETKQALKLLHQGYRDRSDQLTWLLVDPAFDPLRSDPGFAELLRLVGLAR